MKMIKKLNKVMEGLNRTFMELKSESKSRPVDTLVPYTGLNRTFMELKSESKRNKRW